MPFWSPDSRDLGFFAGGALKRVSAAGGPVRLVTDNVGPWTGYGGTWAADGTIVFSGQTGLFRVPAVGGPATALDETAERGLGARLAEFPAGRPPVPVYRQAVDPDRGGQRTGHLSGLAGQPHDRAAAAGPLECGVRAAWVSRLRPRRHGHGRAVRPGHRTRDWPAVAIGGAVATDAQFYFAAISASDDGTLAVRPPPAQVLVFADSNTFDAELHLVDRGGRFSRLSGSRLFSYFMALNPVNSHMLATSILDPRSGTQDLFLMDLAKDSTEPLTATRGLTGNPVWRPTASAWPTPPASRRVRRRVHQGHGHRVDPAPHSRRQRSENTLWPGPTTASRCSSSPGKTRPRICRRGRSPRVRSRALADPGPSKAPPSRPRTTTWCSPHRSLVDLKST